MFVRLDPVKKAMLQNCKQIDDVMMYYIDRNIIIVDTDDELLKMKAAIEAHANLFRMLHMFEESKRYMELAMWVRDLRTELAKEKSQRAQSLRSYRFINNPSIS